MIRIACAVTFAATCAVQGIAFAADAPSPVERLSDRLVGLRLSYDPTIAYSTGFPAADHARLPDHSESGITQLEQQEDALWADLRNIDAETLPDDEDRATYAILREELAASRGLRICNAHYWNVNHFGGWQIRLPRVAQAQPIETEALREQALTRWSSFPRYVEVELENLRHGLSAGYSAPKSVVQRVIRQLDAVLDLPMEKSPFYSPAARSQDSVFVEAYGDIYRNQIIPALSKYRDFLKDAYLTAARSSLGLSALPDGKACYAAFLRRFTTLDRTAEEVFRLGQETVEHNKAVVVETGKRLFGTSDFTAIIEAAASAPENKFSSAEEYIDFSRRAVDRAEAGTRALFSHWPEQTVEVEPIPAYQAGSGLSASYRPEADPAKAARYMLPAENWNRTSRGEAENIAVHETWPGHHLQITTARGPGQDSAIRKLVHNSAYVEGWARYAQRLAEDAGVFETDFASITLRAWPARGMVFDPGIHVFGWSREKAAAYLVSAGVDEDMAEALIDRIAVIPGQLTSYDSGALEIAALRGQAERQLGAKFDLAQFHHQVLKQGILPLAALRDNIQAWIEENRP